MNNLKVSVIITTYKGQSTICRAISSIVRQTYKNIEIIIVDDNNPETDERRKTEEIIESLSIENLIYVKHEKNKNGAAARNTGLRIASGHYVCFLDDDDVYLRERIAKSVMILEKNTKYGVIFCDVLHLGVGWSGRVWKMNEDQLTPTGILLNESTIGTGSNIFLLRSIAKEVNGFDETFLRHQDLEFCIRVLTIANPIILNEVLVIKHYNATDNHLIYKNLKELKLTYSQKFAHIIDKMSDSDHNQFLYNTYDNLFHTALFTGDKNDVLDSIKLWKSQGFKFSLKMKILSIFAIMKFIQTTLFKKLLRYKHSRKKILFDTDIRNYDHAILEEISILFKGEVNDD